MNAKWLVVFSILILLASSNQIFRINLDQRPEDRYTAVSSAKSQLIQKFISYLKNNVQKFKRSFAIVELLHKVSSEYIRGKVGKEFYLQCLSVARGANVKVSQIIVFNYMYQLGAATKFCTAITVSNSQTKLLGRNLDYGFQAYLAHNSLHFQYFSKGELLFQTLGHAGFVGTHTAFKRSTTSDGFSYAITLNERVDGGLHKNIQNIVLSNCQTCPYTTMKALRNAKGDVNEVFKYIDKINTCSPVYWTVISRNGDSYVIQKNRGQGTHQLRQSSNRNGFNYIVQTNHDSDVSDPDGRSDSALSKLQTFIESYNNTSNSDSIKNKIWTILRQSPNFNDLTLMTSLIDVQNAVIRYQIWNFTTY